MTRETRFSACAGTAIKNSRSTNRAWHRNRMTAPTLSAVRVCQEQLAAATG
jgi:hypothetical protein